MKFVSSIAIGLFTIVCTAGSAVADEPQMGGPMKHIMVSLDGTALMAMVDPGVPTPIMQNYGETYEGDAGILNGTMYNAQYGWMVEGFWSPPEGSFLWIEQLSATPGLLAYNQGTFDPIFGTAGSSPLIQWDGAMLHNWYAATSTGDYSASYLIYFGDSNGQPTPGYTGSEVALDWTAVPNPGSATVLGLGGLLAARRQRRA